METKGKLAESLIKFATYVDKAHSWLYRCQRVLSTFANALRKLATDVESTPDGGQQVPRQATTARVYDASGLEDKSENRA